MLIKSIKNKLKTPLRSVFKTLFVFPIHAIDFNKPQYNKDKKIMHINNQIKLKNKVHSNKAEIITYFK